MEQKTVEDLLQKLAGSDGWKVRPDGVWVDAPALDPVAAAELLRGAGARLSTLSAIAREDGETWVIDHYLLDGTALNLRYLTRGGHLPSIAAAMPAANWIEREIHDLFAVQFDGHPDPRRLVRPPEVPEGFFRRPGGAAARQERKV
jgi:hypothetical protein